MCRGTIVHVCERGALTMCMNVCKRNVNTIRTVEMNKRRVEEIEMQKKRSNEAAAAERR